MDITCDRYKFIVIAVSLLKRLRNGRSTSKTATATWINNARWNF
jgi:hypothetical protein